MKWCIVGFDKDGNKYKFQADRSWVIDSNDPKIFKTKREAISIAEIVYAPENIISREILRLDKPRNS